MCQGRLLLLFLIVFPIVYNFSRFFELIVVKVSVNELIKKDKKLTLVNFRLTHFYEKVKQLFYGLFLNQTIFAALLGENGKRFKVLFGEINFKILFKIFRKYQKNQPMDLMTR